MKILIADNAQDVVKLLKEVLINSGHGVDTAFDGKEAMEFLESAAYDLVFLDHDMPEMTGIELIKFIRTRGMKTKIVMISGYPTMQEFFVKTLGADEYIPKPFSIDEVLKIVTKYEMMLKKYPKAS